MIFTGAKLDVGLYNDLLYRQGTPAPALRLEEPGRREHPRADRRAAASLAAGEAAGAEALGAGAGRGPADHDGGRAGRQGDQVRVLARWNDPGRSPAIVERVVGDGRVLLWTTTADRAGNDWPIEPSFVLAVREAVRGSARPTSLANTVTAGERMRRVVRSNQPVSNVRLNPPGGGEPRSLSAAPGGRGPGRPRPGRRDRGPRHPPARAVPHLLGRGAAGQPAGCLRGQPRPARERPGADRGRPT